MRIHVDYSQAEQTLVAAGAGIGEYLEDLKKEITLEGIATMKPITPRAVKKWTKDTVIGELQRSITFEKRDDDYVFGPTATHRGYPYGVAVSRGIAWGGRPAQAGPRPFAEWTLAELDKKVDRMAERLLDEHLQKWS